MPNWCQNAVEIRGEPALIRELAARIVKTDDKGEPYFCFEGICPMPQELNLVDAGNNPELSAAYERNLERFGAKNWYDWRLINWGTKWDAYESYVSVSDDCIDLSFDTAWSPPEGIYSAICAVYPTLSLRADYFEEGCFFAGYYLGADGELEDYPCEEDGVIDFACEVFGYDPTDFSDGEEEIVRNGQSSGCETPF
ncbi:hypothetical protein [Stenoxybacter acetivorans]|uniref:DUF1281 family ferredoxin-like fold protein n=1 Tax=Stenoxybacter acetivorans TaxID=422441 RepID=UPI000689BD87|nr:hypothetical protein [Stenoxybacter acetivorans]